MRIVVDTNIVFSAILNTNGKIGELLFNTSNTYFTCNFLKLELDEHHEKLKLISKLSDLQISKAKNIIFNRITFLNTELIDDNIRSEVELFMKDIDPDDTDFICLAKQLDAQLWTGDKKLHNKLLQKGYNYTILTDDLWNLSNWRSFF